MPFNTLFTWWIGRRMDRIHDYRKQPIANQARTLEFLLLEGAQSAYGRQFKFVEVANYTDFKNKACLLQLVVKYIY